MTYPGPARAPVLRATLAVSGGLAPVGDAWERVLGWTTADIVGTTFIERVHPDDRDHVIAAIHAAYASGAIAVFGCRYARKDGSYRRMAWEASPLPGLIELDLAGWPEG